MAGQPTCKTLSDGTKQWHLNGELHRTDGPAIEWADGTKAWYLNGEQVAEAEHAKRTANEFGDD